MAVFVQIPIHTFTGRACGVPTGTVIFCITFHVMLSSEGICHSKTVHMTVMEYGTST